VDDIIVDLKLKTGRVRTEWAQEVVVFHYTRLKRLATDKLSSLSDPFASYGERRENDPINFNFFVTY
jgi:hypothetical protein